MMSRPGAGEDAATNNIGSVTVLHSRLRVQAVSQEGRPDSQPFGELAQPAAFRTHPPAAGVSGTQDLKAVPFVQAAEA
jgi:hypothetical protein